MQERFSFTIGIQVVQHGACLGLGLAALGTNNDEIMEELKNHLYLDNAVAGEAAGIALGLVAAGSATERATEILAYAHDTQHEKVSHYPHKCNKLYRLDTAISYIITKALKKQQQQQHDKVLHLNVASNYMYLFGC